MKSPCSSKPLSSFSLILEVSLSGFHVCDEFFIDCSRENGTNVSPMAKWVSTLPINVSLSDNQLARPIFKREQTGIDPTNHNCILGWFVLTSNKTRVYPTEICSAYLYGQHTGRMFLEHSCQIIVLHAVLSNRNRSFSEVRIVRNSDFVWDPSRPWRAVFRRTACRHS